MMQPNYQIVDHNLFHDMCRPAPHSKSWYLILNIEFRTVDNVLHHYKLEAAIKQNGVCIRTILDIQPSRPRLYSDDTQLIDIWKYIVDEHITFKYATFEQINAKVQCGVWEFTFTEMDGILQPCIGNGEGLRHDQCQGVSKDETGKWIQNLWLDFLRFSNDGKNQERDANLKVKFATVK